MYLACKRPRIPRSGCNTGERGTRSDCIPAANALVHPFSRRSYVEAGGGYLDSLSTAQTVGGTPGQQTVQYNITIQATSHRPQVQSSDSATYQPRCAQLVRPLSFPFYLAPPSIYVYRTSLFPRGDAYTSALSLRAFSPCHPSAPIAAFRLRSIAFRLGSTSPSDYI